MSQNLSYEAVREYVDGGAENCPYCKSADIEGGERDYGGSDLYQEITCKTCGESWSDHYKVIGIGSIDVQDPSDLLKTLQTIRTFASVALHDDPCKAKSFHHIMDLCREAVIAAIAE